MLGMSILSLLELRSVILQHRDNKEMIGLQSATTALTILILLMEILTPRTSNFVRKTKILEARTREASDATITNGNRSVSPPSNGDDDSSDERTSLLPHSRRQMDDTEDEDDDMSEDEEVLAALDMLDDEASVAEPKERENVKPPPEVGASIFSLATFTYIGCKSSPLFTSTVGKQMTVV